MHLGELDKIGKVGAVDVGAYHHARSPSNDPVMRRHCGRDGRTIWQNWTLAVPLTLRPIVIGGFADEDERFLRRRALAGENRRYDGGACLGGLPSDPSTDLLRRAPSAPGEGNVTTWPAIAHQFPARAG